MSLPPPPPPSLAAETFFSITELVELVCSFLTSNQIFMLVLTNKSLYKIAAPLLWRNVDLDADNCVEMLYRPEGRTLLSTVADCIKINKIRSLKAGFAFMSYYLHGVRQHLGTGCPPQQDIRPSEWIPANQVTAPLPLIKKLNRLDVSLLHQQRFSGSFFAGLNNAPPLAPRLLAFMNLNAKHLTSVSLQHFSIKNIIDIRRLCSIIRSMSSLAHLAIDHLANGNDLPPFSVITALFFSCPTSLVSFSMMATVRNDEELENQEYENEEYFRTPQERSGPFTNLKYLKLPQHSTGYAFEQLNLILNHCPALEEWVNIPSSLNRLGEPMQPVRGRLTCPPTLLDLSTHPGRSCKGEAVAGIMDSIEENKLKSLDFHMFEDTPPIKPDRHAPFFHSLLMHANSLVSISLVDINRIQSKSIKSVLITCAALRTLVIASDNTMLSFITLEDATTKPWACTGLKELRLIINLSRGCDNEYSLLNKFYTQIGALENLEVLDLMSACRSRNVSKSYTETTMTCMLALHNDATRRQGFLQSLAKLKNLRVLLGSLHLRNQEMSSMVGEAEVSWILENWPRLETIEFISEMERRLGPKYPCPFQIDMLNRRRHNLQFYRPYCAFRR